MSESKDLSSVALAIPFPRLFGFLKLFQLSPANFRKFLVYTPSGDNITYQLSNLGVAMRQDDAWGRRDYIYPGFS